ncbi:MAG: hypothetical protein R6U96_15625 [Promethearchaeia archaeon]
MKGFEKLNYEFSGKTGTDEGYSLAQDEGNWFKVTSIPNDNNLSIILYL